ncbi:MAG: VOC family protein [Saprospiraceae bacterium]|nr:VOC family protein [Saprospiraceae bacterium]
MKIKTLSVPVGDQQKALEFYTEKLGFQKNQDIPLGGGNRWLTVVSPEEPDGPEILLEPAPLHFEPSKVYQQAIYEKGMPWTQFNVDDCQAEYDKLVSLGVEFRAEPKEVPGAKMAILDDTCGNYIMIVQVL